VDRLHLRYYGDSLMLGGPEMVRDQNAIGDLINDDTAGVMLPWDITVNDSLVLRGNIYTEQDPTRQWELYYSNTIDPLYVGQWPEIIGTMTRTFLVDNKVMKMNNDFSSIYFANASERGNVLQYAIRSMPRTRPLPLTDITFKVDRFLQMEARDIVGAFVADGTYQMTYGYAWRATYDSTRETPNYHETIPQLRGQEDILVLMRYDGVSYNEHGLSRNPTTSSTGPIPGMWRYSTATNVTNSGDFAIGLSTGPIWVLNTKVFLEGALRTYGENFTPTMATDLATNSLVPNIAPNMYPYNLDPDRLLDTAALPIGDTIVDWVTVEFRTSPTASGPADLYETLLLTNSGQMLDPGTMLPRVIAGLSPGFYNIAVRHRNHLAAIKEDKVLVSRTNIGFVVDFSTGVGMLGGAVAQKLIGTSGGRRYFGLIAGEVTESDDVLRNDYDFVWTSRNLEGYLLHDTDLNGIVTTRDINISWNNRERISVVPR